MRYIKFFLKICVVFFLCLLIIWAIVAALFQTKQGRDWFTEKSKTLIELRTGYIIEFENVDLIFPLGLRIDKLKISDRNETLATIEEIKGFCLSPHLLQGKIVCSSLSAQGIKIFSFGKSENPVSPIKEALPVSFSLPYYLKIENIDIKDVRFMPNLTGSLPIEPAVKQHLENLSFDLKGMLGNNPYKPSFNTHLILTANDQTRTLPPFTLGVNAQNSQISFSFHTDRVPIPECEFTASLSLFATGTFQSWTDLLNDSKSDIEGKFKISIPEKEIIIKSKYTLLSKKDLKLTSLKFKHPLINVKGEARISDEEVVESSFHGKIHDLENEFLLKGQIDGPFNDLAIKLEIDTPKFQLKELIFENIHSSIQTHFDWNKADGIIDLNFESKQIPYHAITDFKWNKEINFVYFKELVIEALQSRLIGEIKIDTQNYFLDGFIQAQSTELKPWFQLAELDMTALADLRFNFKPIFEKGLSGQGIECHLDARHILSKELTLENLNLQSTLNPDTFELLASLDFDKLKWKDHFIESGSAKLECKNLLSDVAGRCEFTVNQSGNASLTIQSISGQTDFASFETSWPFRIQAYGDSREKWEMQTSGFWHATSNNMKLQVTDLQGFLGNSKINLQTPVDFLYNSEQIALNPFRLKLGESLLTGSFFSRKEQFTLDFQADHLHTDLIKIFSSSLPFSGFASLKGHLEGDLSLPKGLISIDFQKIRFNEDHLIKKALLQGEIILELKDKGIEINSRILGIGENPLLVKGTLPYHLSLMPFDLNRENAPLLDLDVRGEGDLGAYLPIFTEDFPNITGKIKMALQLVGDPETPSIKGFLDLEEGVYEDTETGAIYDHIDAHLEGQGSKIILKNLTANDHQGGSLKVEGLITLDPENHFPFDFRVYASKVYLIHSDYTSISASGPLSLIGNMHKSKLSGHLNVDQSFVKLEEALPKQIKSVEVNYINVPEGDPLARNDKGSKSALEFDIKLNAQEVTIDGNGLKSSWKGEIAVSGTSKQPLLFGDLHISQGQYDLKGKTFNLTQGSIHFAGSAEKKTTLYVVAGKEIDNMKVEIIVKGPLNKLSFSFRSNPPLSQREILSYILFNKGISDITSGEGDTLNQSFISLNSLEQTDEKQDLLTRLRNNIGIDRLDFTSTGEGENKDFALQVGKYIWHDVFISLNKSIGAAPDRIAIEAKLMKNVKAEAEVDIGSSSQGKISLKWKKDY